ncbi:MAG: rhomboid family intramembrane serine protease [Chitinophagaceae bacterium]|nr:MAG: rhomboid family intramembrane serine protease [Chitinophagaceae bacterium]
MPESGQHENAPQKTGAFQGLYFKGKIPVITLGICVVCIALFLLVNIPGDAMDGVRSFLSPGGVETVNGAYWGLVTSNFVHYEIWHIFFNLSWIWYLGREIEHNENKWFYLLLVLTSAVASSLAQLSVSDSSGIGISGVVYAIFGYILLRKRSSGAYTDTLPTRTIHFFLIWLSACVVLTQLGILLVANGGHAGGLIWGLVIGAIARYKRNIQVAIGVVGMTAFTVWLAWSPYTTVWLLQEAFRLHDQQQLAQAMTVYKKILDRDPASEVALINIKNLDIYNLELQLDQLYKSGQFDDARQLIQQILAIDPDNENAKETLKILPAD